ncbi:3-deoxy-7-phosphoheptulonate synthase class II [Streptomyces sp. NPDC099050]|uniref:3-deoxy-7-phosphoheptulonate synthase class II n=1 Tax=Streptomyces sp. NPDC099050 TaxID=3366100 RepID=UPI00382D2C8D
MRFPPARIQPSAEHHWRSLPAAQQPVWPDAAALDRVLRELSSYPGLVTAEDCDRLTSRMAEVARGEALLLQGGSCAETFADSSADRVGALAALLSDMADVVAEASSLPVVTVARMAGQYAKPRSQPNETRDGVTLPAYRGDAVNGRDFTPAARTPDPVRLLESHRSAATTLSHLRAMRHGRSEVFVSHEGLLLDYESALTRTDPRGGRRYAASGHMLWIGERTRDLAGAHLAYFAAIANPVAVKLGPSATPAMVVSLANRLDPHREPGRLTFIARMGADRVRDVLPALVLAAESSGSPVSWVCDPMHGNTVVSPSGRKTREFSSVMEEVRGFFEVHRTLGTHAGGVHAELCADDVTECTGGLQRISDADLARRYETACDPRLNGTQAREFAARLSELARVNGTDRRLSVLSTL